MHLNTWSDARSTCDVLQKACAIAPLKPAFHAAVHTLTHPITPSQPLIFGPFRTACVSPPTKKNLLSFHPFSLSLSPSHTLCSAAAQAGTGFEPPEMSKDLPESLLHPNQTLI